MMQVVMLPDMLSPAVAAVLPRAITVVLVFISVEAGMLAHVGTVLKIAASSNGSSNSRKEVKG